MFDNSSSNVNNENKAELSMGDIQKCADTTIESYIKDQDILKYQQNFIQFARNRSGYGKLQSQFRHKARDKYDDNIR